MRTITLPVRHLVEFVLRSGGLAAGFTGGERLLEGVRGHRLIQQSRPAGYAAEVPVTHRVYRDGMTLDITGRIDGLLIEEERLLVEEIKTVAGPPDPDSPDNPLHWAQAGVYAYMVACRHDREAVEVQLTYVALEPWGVWEDRRRFSREELARRFDDLLARYLAWSGPHLAWPLRRDASIASLDFPFPAYRQGQRRLLVAVYRAIQAEERLFVQAPTGIGKTVSILFPAVKALGKGRAEKVFYLTARTTGRAVAEKTLDDMRSRGLAVKSVTLTARDRICFRPGQTGVCDPAQCGYAIGYFDRINDALADTFVRHDAMTREVIEAQAYKHGVCPFALSLDLALWADVVIGDYNYVFDPRAYLRGFFLDRPGRYVFLIDEAHHLVDRGREMFSAQISKSAFLDLRRMIKPYEPVLARRLSGVNDALLAFRKYCEEEGEYGRWVSAALPEGVIPPLQAFTGAAEEVLSQNRPFPGRDALLDRYFEAAAFLRIAERYDERYVAYAEKFGQDITLRLFCLDPSSSIREGLDRGMASVCFSATLLPLPYFREMLGGAPDDPALTLESPFPAEHLCLLVADGIRTTYRERDRTCDEVADAVAAVVRERPGHYLAFFPSYRYMEAVCERFCLAYPDLRVRPQTAGMTEAERAEFLIRFEADSTETLVGFAVMGGLFGESIDLAGDRLIGTIIVGVGLPQVSLERDLIRGYFTERDLDGFAYAYRYPGMNRVLQAAGRVIRTPEDRGVVLLIDERFSQAAYRELFPPGWPPAQRVRGAEGIRKAVRAFWAAEKTSSAGKGHSGST
jgi:DNA excision repair protein ERCC-2